MPRIIRYENPMAEGLAAFGSGVARGAASDRLYQRDRADQFADSQVRANEELVADQLQHEFNVDRDRQKTDLDRQYGQEDDVSLEQRFRDLGHPEVIVQNGKVVFGAPETEQQRVQREAEAGRADRADAEIRMRMAVLRQQMLRDAQSNKRGWGGIIQRGMTAFGQLAQRQAELDSLKEWRERQDENADADRALDAAGLKQKADYTNMLRDKAKKGVDLGKELDRLQGLYNDMDRAGKKKLQPMLDSVRELYLESLSGTLVPNAAPTVSGPYEPTDADIDAAIDATGSSDPAAIRAWLEQNKP